MEKLTEQEKMTFQNVLIVVVLVLPNFKSCHKYCISSRSKALKSRLIGALWWFIHVKILAQPRRVM